VVHHEAQQQQPQEALLAGPGCDANGNNATANARSIPYESTLSPKPWTLYELWAEYEHGIVAERLQNCSLAMREDG